MFHYRPMAVGSSVRHATAIFDVPLTGVARRAPRMPSLAACACPHRRIGAPGRGTNKCVHFFSISSDGFVGTADHPVGGWVRFPPGPGSGGYFLCFTWYFSWLRKCEVAMLRLQWLPTSGKKYASSWTLEATLSNTETIFQPTHPALHVVRMIAALFCPLRHEQK